MTNCPCCRPCPPVTTPCALTLWPLPCLVKATLLLVEAPLVIWVMFTVRVLLSALIVTGVAAKLLTIVLTDLIVVVSRLSRITGRVSASALTDLVTAALSELTVREVMLSTFWSMSLLALVKGVTDSSVPAAQTPANSGPRVQVYTGRAGEPLTPLVKYRERSCWAAPPFSTRSPSGRSEAPPSPFWSDERKPQ